MILIIASTIYYADRDSIRLATTIGLEKHGNASQSLNILSLIFERRYQKIDKYGMKRLFQ